MITISADKSIVTFINVFTVAPEKQQELVDLLVRAASPMSRVPGFIAASIHRSLDGTKVANYAQWHSVEDFHAMQKDPAAQPHMEEETALAKFEPGLYSVVSIHAAPALEAAPTVAV
jgi:heme-degrading monooxygenase HmoA